MAEGKSGQRGTATPSQELETESAAGRFPGSEAGAAAPGAPPKARTGAAAADGSPRDAEVPPGEIPKIWQAVPLPAYLSDDERSKVRVRRLNNSIGVIAKKAVDENDVTIVGSMLPVKPKDADGEKKLIRIPANLFVDRESAEDTLFVLRGKYRFTRIVGYLPTEQEGCYVRVVRRNWVLALIPLILAIAVAAAILLLQNGGIPGLTMDPNQTDPWEAQQATPQSNDTITVNGVSAIKVDSTHTTWPLENPDVNASYFKYTCTCNGATVFESDWIEPGKAVPFNVYEALGGRAGTYTVTINIATRDMNSHAEQNGATYDVAVTVY